MHTYTSSLLNSQHVSLGSTEWYLKFIGNYSYSKSFRIGKQAINQPDNLKKCIVYKFLI